MPVINTQLPFALPELQGAESPAIEPGLLPTFRLIVALQIGLMLVSIAIVPITAPAPYWQPFAFASLGRQVLLFGYLSWTLLQRTLGRFFLPLALWIMSVGPILERLLLIYFQTQQTSLRVIETEIVLLQWRLFVILLAPLVLIAWQYNFRWVLFFSIGTTLLTQTLAFWLLGFTSFYRSDVAELSVSGVVMFAVAGYIIVALMRAQRQHRQALEAANSQLIGYATTAEQLAVSRERNRLARDLHDTLAHTLSAVSIQLEGVNSVWERSPAEARVGLLRSLDTTRSGLGETRRAVQALRASPLEDLGLVLAIRNLAESTAKRIGATLSLTMLNELTLPPELEQNIYRIAQEALTNIVKHAQARQIKVMLQQLNGALSLTIQDDGVGFATSQAAPTGHYGLHGIKERAALINATVEIASTPSQGTTIHLIVTRLPGGKQNG